MLLHYLTMISAIIIVSILALALGLTLMMRLKDSGRFVDSCNQKIDSMQAEITRLQMEAAARASQQVAMETKVSAANAQIAARDTQIADKEAMAADLRRQLEETRNQLRESRTELAESRKQSAEMMKQQEDRFKVVANEIITSSNRNFSELSSRKIDDLLKPLKENIETFRKFVGENQQNSSRQYVDLMTEVRNLRELNAHIGKEAQELSRALRSNSKTQGDWGEMILEKLLENSGLVKGQHFDTQVTKNADGTVLKSPDGSSLRADVVVYYPDGRCVVIDSKVSITDFVEYVRLRDEGFADNDEQVKCALKQHIISVRAHIDELLPKCYQDVIGTKKLDFVIMFIPNEGAYMAAMQADDSLWNYAFKRNVVIASPTHLISMLRMLEKLWQEDKIQKNIDEIARLSGAMLDKFKGMMDAFDDVENALGKAQNSFCALRNRLSEGKGNIFVTARKIKELGAKTNKYTPKELE